MAETVLRVALAAALAAAALAKLSSPRSSIEALATFGLRGAKPRQIGWAALVATELCLAAGVALGFPAAAYAAAALMLLFAALTARAMVNGQSGAPCACFGPRSTVSWMGVARNLALAAAFAILPSAGSLGAEAWLGIGTGVALLACAGLVAAVLALAREIGMLRLQLGTQGALEIAGEGPEVGSRAEQLTVRLRADGARLALAAFTSEGCHICQVLRPAIDNVAKDPLVSVGTFDEVADTDLWQSLGIPGSPFAIALDPDGTVLAKGTFNNLAQLESVLATAVRRRNEGLGEADRDGGLPESGPDRVPVGA